MQHPMSASQPSHPSEGDVKVITSPLDLIHLDEGQPEGDHTMDSEAEVPNDHVKLLFLKGCHVHLY